MRRILPYTLVLLALLLVPTMAVTAQQQVPDKNPTCADVGYSGYEYKLESPTPGTHTIAAGDLDGLEGPAQVTFTVSGDQLSFDWSANFGIDKVIAKGGKEGANVYAYDEALSGSGLQVPTGQELSHISICYDVNPGVNIEKATNGEDADDPTGPEIAIGDIVTWTYIVTNTGDVPLDFSVSDDQGVTVICPTTIVGVDESVTCAAVGVAAEGQYANLGTVSATYGLSATDPSHYIGVPAETPPPSETGEGCSPGYWRQDQHYDDWGDYYSPDKSASAVLGRDVGSITLGQAVALGGGGLNALLRQTVAALLNASNLDVGYAYTPGEVISMFQAAYDSGQYEATKDLFDAANNAGCPLGSDEAGPPEEENPPEPPGQESQVTICHIPPGNPANAHTITVGASAVPAHLAHGDTLGACQKANGGKPDNPGGQGKNKDKGKGGKK
jgi:hypothetical protein